MAAAIPRSFLSSSSSSIFGKPSLIFLSCFKLSQLQVFSLTAKTTNTFLHIPRHKTPTFSSFNLSPTQSLTKPPILRTFSSSSNTNSPISFDFSDSDDDATATAKTKTKKEIDKSKLPPPYDPFSKKPVVEDPKDPKDLQEIFHKMRTEGLIPNAIKMFDALSKDGLTHEAMELFSVIKDKGNMPDVVAHTAVIEAYANAGQSKEALKVYVRMLASGVQPNAYTYTVLIKGLARDAKLADAKKYLMEMMNKGIQPNAGTYTAVFEAFVKEDKVDRTKQGKWLEQGLHDMEEKVKFILQIIEEDGDSFAKRAEMYYKKRPELLNFVEESYRAYRALAERYEHISRELHNANKTIANVCPDQVEFEMDDDADDDQVPKKLPNPPSPAPEQLPKPPSPDPSKIPKPVPENPKFNLKANAPRKSSLPPKPKKPQSKKIASQKSKDEAHEKIDKLQKGILLLQTEKEFIKSSYESALAKYWDIDNQIIEMQEEICSLQDEFSVDADETVIEDNEARALMMAMALKSCKDTLVQLREQQKRSMRDGRVESQRVNNAKERLKALKDGSLEHWTENGKLSDSTAENSEGDFCVLKQERLELQSICEKIKGYFDMNSNTTTTVTELVEMVDGLVTAVLGLETTVSSQTAAVERLRYEMDELQKRLSCLEEDKDWSGKVTELEEELHGVQDLNQSVKDQNNELSRSFTETCHTFDGLFKKLDPPKQKDEEVEITGSSKAEERVSLNAGRPHEPAQEGEATIHSVNLMNKIRAPEADGIDIGMYKQLTEEDSLDWQQLFLNGLEDREKILMMEYTSILRNYKETKLRLSEMEKRSQETLAKVMELNSSNATKDVEIWSLRQKLGLPHTSSLGNPDTDTHLIESKDSAVNRSKSSDYDAKTTYFPSNKILAELLYEQNGKYIARRGYSSTSMLTETPPKEEGSTVATELKHISSGIEEKFRRDIDQLLEENLQFWLRFSSSFHQIQKFQTVVQELQTEVSKLRKESKKQDSSTNASDPPTTEAVQINKRIKDVHTELFLWLEQNVLMKEELQCRMSSLGNIREEISKALKTCSESEKAEFTSLQASKFQGEIRNMQQENNKVSNELQAGLDHVRKLQIEIQKLSKMRGIEPSGSKNSNNRYHNVRYSTSRNKIPLRNFIFGAKPKKPLVVSGQNPAVQKQLTDGTGDKSPM